MRRSIPERLDLVDRHLARWAMVGQPTSPGCSEHCLDAQSLRHEESQSSYSISAKNESRDPHPSKSTRAHGPGRECCREAISGRTLICTLMQVCCSLRPIWDPTDRNIEEVVSVSI